VKPRLGEGGVEFERESIALPCLIPLYQRNSEAILATLKPTALLLSNAPHLGGAAQGVGDTIVNILKKAALI
jgi:hypothetical protein